MSAGVGERVELGRYTISAGERVIYGQRVLGVVRVVDVPAGGRGRRYIIERASAGAAAAGTSGPRDANLATSSRACA